MTTNRGTGRTTEQLVNAPRDSVFVWVNGRMDYIVRLARHLSRGDIKVVAPSWLTGDRWRGLELKGVVVDHALRLNPEQYDTLCIINARVRK